MTKYIYIRNPRNQNNVLTVGTEVVVNKDNTKELKVAFALAHSKLDPFTRRKGRAIVDGRLQKEGCYTVTNFTGKSEQDVMRLMNTEMSKGFRMAVFNKFWSKAYITLDKTQKLVVWDI